MTCSGVTQHGRESRVCPSPSSAGCFFGDEVRGSGESCGPSDSEAERPGPEPEPAPEVTSPASTPAELPWTNIDLKEPKRGPSHTATGFAEASDLSSLGLLPLGLEEPEGADGHPLWAWVSGGGCAVEAHSTLKWFTVQSGKGSSVPGGGGGAGLMPPTGLSPSV